MVHQRIGVFGAGSVGCYVGGRLVAAGADVVLVGRPRIGASLRAHGLHVSDLDGFARRVALDDDEGPGRLRFSEEAADLGRCSLVLVTVKSGATREAGERLAQVLAAPTTVISFQNGVQNADILEAALPGLRVLTGMVPFNVLQRGDGRFHQGTEGRLAVARDSAITPYAPLFHAAGLPFELHADMRAVQWGKLLLNLNNAINALSGLPLAEQLAQRDYRRCLALAQREALSLLRQTGQQIARLTPLPPWLMPYALATPDAVFRRVAPRTLAIDPLARSSMWEDLAAGRRTEVDYINGEVLRLAERAGRQAPVNAALVQLIREAEAGGPRDLEGGALLARLRAEAGARP